VHLCAQKMKFPENAAQTANNRTLRPSPRLREIPATVKICFRLAHSARVLNPVATTGYRLERYSNRNSG
jgi:hypothetical protein